jgi:RNA polymerase sigma-70 factor (ECF subfamily)
MKTFLYPAVKNLSILARRKRARHAGDETASSEMVAKAERASASREELATVLASLDDAHREVLLMRFVDDMTLREIADTLAIPLGTVKSRLHHALATLRDDPRTREYFEE